METKGGGVRLTPAFWTHTLSLRSNIPLDLSRDPVNEVVVPLPQVGQQLTPLCTVHCYLGDAGRG